MGLGLSPSRFDVTTVAGSGGADRLVPGLAIDAVVADVALGVSEGARERGSEGASRSFSPSNRLERSRRTLDRTLTDAEVAELGAPAQAS